MATDGKIRVEKLQYDITLSGLLFARINFCEFCKFWLIRKVKSLQNVGSLGIRKKEAMKILFFKLIFNQETLQKMFS